VIFSVKLNLQQAYEHVAAVLPTPIDTTGSISKTLANSLAKLQDIWQKAVQKQKDFLQSLASAAHTQGNKKKGKLMQHLLHAEQTHWYLAIIKNYLKPRTPGSLTHLLIPDPHNTGEWRTLYQPEKIEAAMHTQCQQHFRQAHRSPYTVLPLSDLLGTNSLTKFGDALLQGTANLDTLQVSPHTKLLLQHHQHKYPKYKDTHLPLWFKDLM